MIISYEWLKSLLPGLTADPSEVARVLTMHSFETVLTKERRIDPHVTVVRIEKIEPHPNAGRLQLATVTDGYNTIRVVCGAPNIYEGALVPFSPPGTKLYDQQGKLLTLKTATIRGVESPGMLNSLRELGIGSSQSGIFLLPTDIPVGAKLHEYVPNDTVLEADITRNRAHDCLSIRGIAREISAILDIPLNEAALHQAPLPLEKGEWQFKTKAADDVVRYIGVAMKNVKVGPSPLWLQARLLSMGTRPINNVVDATNYVMFELGNPVHAFDADSLPGATMGVRFAKADETVTTLDKVERTLQPRDLVITSNDQPVAVAGIMGGSSSQVTETTTRILIEVANFAPYTIQQSAQQLGLRTEASNRFAKGIDPEIAHEAAARIVALLTEVAGATAVQTLDYYPVPREHLPIAFNPQRLSALVGVDVSLAEAQRILTALRFTLQGVEDDTWQVTAPSDRLDIEGEHDLIEEVLRVYGLEKVEGQAPEISARSQKLPAAAAWREAIRDRLISLGMTETYNYSFAPGVLALKLGEKEANALKITNPIAPELHRLRQSLLPGLVQNISKNKGEVRIQQLFEIGTVFSRGSGGVVPGVREKTQLACAVVIGEKGSDLFVEMIIDQLLSYLGITNITKRQETNELLGEYTTLRHHRRQLGHFRMLSQEMRRELKFESPVALFEIDLDALIALATNRPPQYQPPRGVQQYQAFSKYPPVWRDISLIVGPEVRIEGVQEVIERAGGKLVKDVDLFDVYDASDVEHDENLSKSLAFHIKYQSDKKTLTDEEIRKVHNTVVATLKQELGAVIRE